MRSTIPSPSMSIGYAPVTPARSVAGSTTRRELQGTADLALVPVQRGRAAATADVEVGPSVAVAVECREPAAHRIGEIPRVRVVDAGRRGLVDEPGRPKPRARRLPTQPTGRGATADNDDSPKRDHDGHSREPSTSHRPIGRACIGHWVVPSRLIRRSER